jgi:IPT/TIG domain-containing protein
MVVASSWKLVWRRFETLACVLAAFLALTGGLPASAVETPSAPTITSITPIEGSTKGGTRVTITGTGFVTGSTVKFASNDATSVTFVSATELKVTSPAGTAGAVSVSVILPSEETAVLASAFTYKVPPTISSITPNIGPPSAGNTIVIAGNSYGKGVKVTFGTVAATSVVLNSSSQLTVTVPANTVGTYNVTVTDADGLKATMTNGYSYVAPAISSLTPPQGPVAGGTQVTIAGSGFLSGATVTFGGTAATSVTVVSSTQVQATTPAGSPSGGSVAVVLTNPGGLTATSSFTYIPPPTISSLNPASGNVQGGTRVTFAGTGFLSGATVTFGGLAATSVTFTSSTQIAATTPAYSNNTGGPVPVVLTNPDGQSASSSFDYIGSQTLTSISPVSGPAAGGISVDIYGSGYTPTTQILFGDNSATAVTLVNSLHITCTLPAGIGTVNVSAFTPGAGSASLANAFTYIQPLAVTGVSPTIGPTVGNYPVTVTGTGFVSGATVTFGSAAPISADFVNSDTLTVTAPAHAQGTVNVTVTNPSTASATLSSSYTFTNGPSVWTITPDSGPEQGGGTIILGGRNLSTVSAVKFGSTSATILSTGPDQVQVKQPASTTAGTVNVTVTNPNGTQTIDSGFTYLALAIGTQILDDGYPAIPYSNQLETNGAGLPPYTWSVSSGKLPPGLSLNDKTGLVSGTPSGPPNANPYTFDIEVKDSATKPHSSQTKFSMNILYGFSQSPIPSTYFGMTLNDPNDWPQLPPQGIGLQVGALAKGLSVSWPFIEQNAPVNGVHTYNWSTLDTYVSQAASHSVDIFYTQFNFPPWAVPDPGNPVNCSAYANTNPPIVACVNMVTNIQDWIDFCTAVVTRYKGQIHMYELYNEPNTAGSFSGTIANMVSLTNSFHDVIRSTDSSALIGAPSSSSWQYTLSYYEAGGTQDVDTVDLHEYPNVTVEDNPEFVITKVVPTKEDMIQEGPTTLATKPLWDTETGWGNNAYAIADPEQRAAFVARFLLLQWSVGVERSYWYAWDEPNWGTLFNEESPGVGVTLPAGLAYQQVETWMLGANMQMPCSGNGGSQFTATYTCNLFRSGGYQAEAVWNAGLTCENGVCATMSYTPDSIYVQYRDIAGNVHTITTPGSPVSIGAQPILLENQTSIP